MSKIKKMLSFFLTIVMMFTTVLSTGMIAHASMLPLKEETVYLILNKETNDQLKEMKISTILGKLQDSNGNLVSVDKNATTAWRYFKDAESGLESYEAYLIDDSDGKRIDLSQPTGASMQTIELIVGKDGQLNNENIRYIVKVYYTGYSNNITYDLYSQSADGTNRTKIEPLKKTYSSGSYNKIVDINGDPVPMFNAVYSVPEGDIINPYLGIKCSIDERPDVRVPVVGNYVSSIYDLGTQAEAIGVISSGLDGIKSADLDDISNISKKTEKRIDAGIGIVNKGLGIYTKYKATEINNQNVQKNQEELEKLSKPLMQKTNLGLVYDTMVVKYDHCTYDDSGKGIKVDGGKDCDKSTCVISPSNYKFDPNVLRKQYDSIMHTTIANEEFAELEKQVKEYITTGNIEEKSILANYVKEWKE